MSPDFAREAVAYHWRMPYANWRLGVHVLLARFG